MKRYKFDFHIHTCLSPCAEDDMTPANIVSMAKFCGLSVIAITDHNSCANCAPAIECGKRAGVLVLAGMELTVKEEAHLICLFPELKSALLFEKQVQSSMPKLRNNVEIFGSQKIVDDQENLVGEYPYMLSGATGIGCFEAAELARSFGGIAYPAHIDRTSMSVISTLGFITEDMGFKLVEFSKEAVAGCTVHNFSHLYPSGMPFITGSDAHFLGAMTEDVFEIDLEELTGNAVIEKLHSKMGIT